MNCQELARVLDECELHELPAEERAAVEEHLAACVHCASDHDLHLRVAALPIPPLGAERVAIWRALASPGAMAARSRGVARGRLVLIGTLAAVAAAAAVLTTSVLKDPDAVVVVSTPAPAIREDGPPVPRTAPVATAPAPEAARAPPEPQLPPAAAAELRPFTILVQTLQDNTSDVAAQAAAHDLYEFIVRELRAQPGVTVIGPQASIDMTHPGADYVLTAVARGGGSSQPPQGASESLRNSPQWSVMLRLSGHFGGRRLVQPILINGFLSEADCRAANASASAATCDPAGPAREGLRVMRTLMFQPDPALESSLRQKFLDESRPMSERQKALQDLAFWRLRVGQGLDADLVRVVLDLVRASRDDSSALALLRVIDGMAGPEAVGPLVDATSQQRNLELRMEATTQLAKYHFRDPTARAALEWLAINDPYPRLRGVAQAAVERP